MDERKNRFYMTDSLIKKLNEDKPKRAEIFDLLGTLVAYAD